MLKQPKKYYRGVWGKGRDRRKKSGFHREMALACNEEHLPFIRSKRNKQALYNYSDFSYEREAEPNPDQLSWKHRCKKRHQWVKHRYSFYEWEIFLAWKCRQHKAHELLKFLEENPGWIKFDLRDNPLIENAIDVLAKSSEIDRFCYNFYAWDTPVAAIRLKQKKEDTSVQDEIVREEYFMNDVRNREKVRKRRLPINHKYVCNKKELFPISSEERIFCLSALEYQKNQAKSMKRLLFRQKRAKAS